jgi:hypothetical protein
MQNRLSQSILLDQGYPVLLVVPTFDAFRSSIFYSSIHTLHRSIKAPIEAQLATGQHMNESSSLIALLECYQGRVGFV